MPDTLPSKDHNEAGIHSDLEAFEAMCSRLAAEGVKPENLGLFGKAKGDDVKLRKAINAEKAEKKKPHLEANAQYDAEANLRLDRVAKALKPVMDALDAFNRAEDAKRQEAARKAREAAEAIEREAARVAAAAKEAQADPFADFDAEQAEADAAAARERAEEAATAATARTKITNADGGRSVSYRSTWSAELVDGAALVAFYATMPTVIEAALSVANAQMRATKGTAIIPGVKALEKKVLA